MKKLNMMALLLFLTGLLCIASLLLFTRTTEQRIADAEENTAAVLEQVVIKRNEIKEAENNYSKAVEETEANIKRMKQKAQTVQEQKQQERADVLPEEETGPSVFNGTVNEDIFTSESGHIVAIDPGHQSENVDMSALEPNGPGSSEMKAKCTTGTEGSYTGVPEYQLNLDISLQLKTVLEQRGYQVVLTRTDNETAISNKERAEYAASQGAEIYVRIHANGDDSHTASGALAIAPSQNNPYVSHLYEDSNRLSWSILDSYCAVTGLDKLGVQYSDTMTGINWSTIPVTILEMGFMTHENDDRLMNDTAFQQTMVNGIADGIDAYFGQNAD